MRTLWDVDPESLGRPQVNNAALRRLKRGHGAQAGGKGWSTLEEGATAVQAGMAPEASADLKVMDELGTDYAGAFENDEEEILEAPLVTMAGVDSTGEAAQVRSKEVLEAVLAQEAKQRRRTGPVGFFRNAASFNTVVTRAKSLVIVIGDPHLYCMDRCWRAVMQSSLDRNTFLEA